MINVRLYVFLQHHDWHDCPLKGYCLNRTRYLDFVFRLCVWACFVCLFCRAYTIIVHWAVE
jgi:hypothetical protein